MEFKHLPMPGGLYDQHPGMLDRFMFIFAEQAREEERQEIERKRNSGQSSPRLRKGATRAHY